MSSVPASLADIDKRLSELAADQELGSRFEAQLAEYGKKLTAELGAHLTDLDLTLHRMEGCGHAFFDETLTISHMIELFDQKSIGEEYDGFVLADTANELDRRVEDFADWLLASEMECWQSLQAQIQDDRSPFATSINERLDKQFDYDRSRLFAVFHRTTRDAVEIFDAGSESKQVGEAARNAATSAVFLGIAAIVTLGTALSSDAATQGLASPAAIAFGLGAAAACVIPYARRRSKKMLHRRVGAFREHLLRDFRRQAEKEILASTTKIQEIIESPLQTVREEQGVLAARREELARLDDRPATPRGALEPNDVEPERP
ncbi:MAG: hypothetical protein O3A53_14840 [Acidobacteria bacterium]|nr:hypothetical protein [Acidobacteriota bacterium]MDA1236062.1 hypothetical protein [Acidobacteriota bacterium]